MNGSVEVSVIVLACNQAGLIGRALDSIIAQRCDFRREIVVSDDCSDDDTRRVVEEYAGRYPDLVRLLPEEGRRRGLVANYFHALSHCRGRFIADCAADDYWLSDNGLQRKYDLLSADRSLSMVCSDWSTFDDALPETLSPAPSLNQTGRVEMIDGRLMIGRELACRGGAAVHLSTVLYRRELLEQAIGDNREMVVNERFGCEDLPVKLALMSRGRVAWIPEPTLAYRVGGVSLSAPRKAAEAARFHLDTSEAIGTLAGYYGIDSATVAPNLKSKIGFAVSVAFKASEWGLVCRGRALSRQFGIGLSPHHRFMAMIARCLAK